VAYACWPRMVLRVNGVSFIAVMSRWAAMKLRAARNRGQRGGAVSDIRAGLRAVTSDKRIPAIIGLMCAMSIFRHVVHDAPAAWAVQDLAGMPGPTGFSSLPAGLVRWSRPSA